MDAWPIPIKVTDRLPHDRQRVMLFGAYWTHATYIAKDRAWHNFDWHRDVPVDEGIYTHWLPEPPAPI